MTTIKFKPPNGPEITNPPIDMLRQLILMGDEQYWCVGSGEGSLTTDLGPNALSLILKEPYGFLLWYVTETGNDFVSIRSTDFSTTVEVAVCGNPWVVPVGFFVSRHKAWEAVEEFCRSGSMSKSLTWGRLAEQQWDFGS
ncbi:MAG: Imm1 family immunity protein [Thermogemmata sp.]|nr:Imm1 family immunity protein [Thermogemmata sp.]